MIKGKRDTGPSPSPPARLPPSYPLHESTTLNPSKAPQTWKKTLPISRMGHRGQPGFQLQGWPGQSPLSPSPGAVPACPNQPYHRADAQVTLQPLNAQPEPGGLQREVKWHFSTETPKLQPLTSSTDHPRPLFPANPKVLVLPLTALLKEEKKN